MQKPREIEDRPGELAVGRVAAYARSRADTGAAGGSEIGAVVFDLGGVLIDWNPRHLYRQLFSDPDEMEDFLARICTPEWHHEHDLGADVTASCQRLAASHPGYEEMIMAWAERGEEMAAGQFGQAVRVLSELKAAGTRCYTLSNMEPQAFTIRSARFPFMAWFDGHVISGMEGVPKPDPQLFQILLERYRLAAEATVFLDDTPRNVEAARALGINAVHYTGAYQLRQDLWALGIPGIAPACPEPPR
jgi:2-haloacid dehalogenase